MSVTKSGIVPQAETYAKEVSSQDQSLYKILNPGEFSLAPMSLYYGAVGRYRRSEKAIVSPAYITFCACGEVSPDFLDLVLRDRRIVQVYSALSQGANKEGKRRTTNFSDFCSIRRPMPQLAEQCAIASVLSEVNSVIEATEALIKELEGAKIAVMRELLTRGLAGEWARMMPLSERWVLGGRAAGITHMPADWRLVRYDEVCRSIQVGIVVQPASLYSDTGVPALRSLNVKENQINRADMVLISENAHKSNKKSELRAGDVVTVRTGVPGISAVVPDDLDGANCIDILISRIGKNAVPGFLAQFLNSSLAKRQIAVLQGGLAQQHLNVKELKGLKLLLPPLDEQRAIADAGEAFDQRIAAERAHLTELRTVKDALAQELLSGRVRLPTSMIARFETAPPHEAAAE